MNESLTPGVAAETSLQIDSARTISFMGEELRVYATPMMVQDLEHLCRDLLYRHCEADEDSVGAHVDLDHLAPTVVGQHVRLSAKVVEVALPRVTFEVTVHDELEQVGRARHVRFVVNSVKQAERLRKKARRWAQAAAGSSKA